MLKQLIALRLKGIFQNQVKSSKSKKASIGKTLLISVLFVYVGITAFGMFGLLFYSLVEPFVLMDIDWFYFSFMAILVIMFSFIGSVFMTQNIVYNASDNDLLLSMPIQPRDILLSRVFTILIFDYVYEIIIALPALIIYILFAGMNIAQVMMFIIIILTLPLFIVAITCLAGWALTHILVRVKHRNLISITFYIIFFALYFYFIGDIENKFTLFIQNGKTIAEIIEKIMFPIYHLGIAIINVDIISLLIYLACALIPFVIVMNVLSKNFVSLAIHKPRVDKVVYKQKELKNTSVVISLMVREWKHLINDAMVFMNAACGTVLIPIAAIGIIFNKDLLIDTINMLMLDTSYIMAIACGAVTSMLTINMMSGASISLEGNRLWILKSLPIKTKDILHSKLLLHLLLTAVPAFILSIVMSVVLQLGFIDTMFVLIVPEVFVLFTGLAGLLINLWKPKFDWVNEVVCVKQSFSTSMTMLGSMGILGIIVGVFILLNKYLSAYMIVSMFLVIFIMADVFMYHTLMHWGVKRFEDL